MLRVICWSYFFLAVGVAGGLVVEAGQRRLREAKELALLDGSGDEPFDHTLVKSMVPRKGEHEPVGEPEFIEVIEEVDVQEKKVDASRNDKGYEISKNERSKTELDSESEYILGALDQEAKNTNSVSGDEGGMTRSVFDVIIGANRLPRISKPVTNILQQGKNLIDEFNGRIVKDIFLIRKFLMNQ